LFKRKKQIRFLEVSQQFGKEFLIEGQQLSVSGGGADRKNHRICHPHIDYGKESQPGEPLFLTIKL
jgi:hypothetical protein